MRLDLVLIASIPFASAFFAAVLLWHVWRKHQKPIGKSIIALLSACGIWAFFYGLELTLPQFQMKVIAAQCQYAGIVFVAPSWCCAAIYSAGLGRHLTRRRLAAMLVIPLVTLVAAVTNPLHGMLWREISIRSEKLPVLHFQYGPLFWINNQFAWLLLFCGTILLLRNVLAGQALYIGQRVLMVLTILAPWLANAAYVFDFGPISGLDLTPFAFVVSGFFLYFGIFRYRISDVVPIARQYVLEHIDDCLFVLDTDSTVIDINHAGEALLGIESGKVIGLHAHKVFAAVPALKRLSVCADGMTARFRVMREKTATTHVAHITSVNSSYGLPLCRIITSWNITTDVEQAESLRESEARYKDLFDESPIALWQEDFSEVRHFLDDLKDAGVKDFERYFIDNPSAVEECARRVIILDVNRCALAQHGAKSKQELLDRLSDVFTKESFAVFRKELAALAEGQTNFSAEAEHKSVTGEVFWVSVHVRVLPGYEESLGCVLVSNINITKEKRAEAERIQLEQQVKHGASKTN